MGHGHGGGGPDARHATAPPKRRRRRWPWVLLAAVLAVLGWGAWLLVDAMNARSELQEASSLVRTLQDQVLEGDRAGAAATLTQLQAHAQRARDTTRGPHWSAARVLPWVGPNVEAVQTVASVVDELSRTALPELMEATDIVDPAVFAPVEGRVDVSALQAAAPTVIAADDAVSAAMGRLDGVDRDALWPQVATPFDDLRGELGGVAQTTATASRAVQLLPAMLGVDEPRDYLLLVQNNAEFRASGGIPGSVILLRAEGGAVSIVETRSGGSLGDLPEPVLPLTDAEQNLFGVDLTADMRDVTFTPDFPRTAQVAAAIWAQQVGGEVDGVLSVDPGALALVLDDTGPVPVPPGPMADALGGQLTADNAVSALLNTVYLTLADPAEQDAFFASTAGSVMSALIAGQGEPAAAVDALAEAARQGRLMVWSAEAAEQELLSGTVLSGELQGDAGSQPVVGVFFNDGSQAKMSYYLQTDIGVETAECRPDGSRLFTVTVTLTNTLSPDAVATLPPYVTGAGTTVPEGEVRTNVLIYAPTDGLVEDVVIADDVPGVTSQVHDGLAVVGRTTQLAPGQSITITAQVMNASALPDEVILRSTPTAKGDKSVTALPLCS